MRPSLRAVLSIPLGVLFIIAILATAVRADGSPSSTVPVDSSDTTLIEEDPSDETETFTTATFTDEQMLSVWSTQRANLGFAKLSDEDLLKLVSSKQGVLTISDNGLPLSQAEQVRLESIDRHRNQVFEKAVPIAAQMEGYAGSYSASSDQGETIVISFTRELSNVETARVLVPVEDKGRVEFRYDQALSLKELEEKRADLASSAEMLSLETVGIDVENNRVVVTRPDRADDEFVPRTGVVVERSTNPVETACTSRFNCNTNLRGGVWAFNEDLSKTCTAAYVADYNINSNVYMITAGHCGNVGDDFDFGGYSHAFQTVTFDSSTQDAMRVGIEAAQGSFRFYRLPTQKVRKLTSRATNASINIGDIVCVHGIRFDRGCGTIVVDSFDDTSGPTPSADSFKFDVILPGNWTCAGAGLFVAGQSGGPVTDAIGRQAVGLYTTCSSRIYSPANNHTQFTLWAAKVRNIESALNVTVRTG